MQIALRKLRNERCEVCDDDVNYGPQNIMAWEVFNRIGGTKKGSVALGGNTPLGMRIRMSF